MINAGTVESDISDTNAIYEPIPEYETFVVKDNTTRPTALNCNENPSLTYSGAFVSGILLERDAVRGIRCTTGSRAMAFPVRVDLGVSSGMDLCLSEDGHGDCIVSACPLGFFVTGLAKENNPSGDGSYRPAPPIVPSGRI
ncbi:unnamed protein product [Darwinula stevensoni]|uniref:Uncharacterized protein n=1 Tax=Darwinula stevensoni TaxID=69355 RepID=A0A7R8X2G1_9CRUS|nr:unnamed protein product [Darwinula stevensoni]CAG0881415.1 unnamed protein product [Darwinula stevensoni]